MSIIQCACAILSSAACPSVPCVLTLSHKRYDFSGKKLTEHKMCFNFLYNVFVKHLHFQEEFGEIQMYIGLHVKCQLFLVDSNEI